MAFENRFLASLLVYISLSPSFFFYLSLSLSLSFLFPKSPSYLYQSLFFCQLCTKHFYLQPSLFSCYYSPQSKYTQQVPQPACLPPPLFLHSSFPLESKNTHEHTHTKCRQNLFSWRSLHQWEARNPISGPMVGLHFHALAANKQNNLDEGVKR